MKSHGIVSSGLIALGCLFLAACASKRSQPAICPALVPLQLPHEVSQRIDQARGRSMARLKAYQIGVTTREMFLSDCWHSTFLTEPIGDIGIYSYHQARSNWVARGASFTMAYVDISGPSHGNDVQPVCKLTFDDQGSLEILEWKDKSVNK